MGRAAPWVTNDQKRYDLAHAYADHGHDHIGDDRGAEGHSILGNNYRISELNAAVGLAQLRKLDTILSIQRKNKAAIKNAMQRFPQISFRYLPDESGDSATFLSFMLPDEQTARQTARKLAEAGVDGCFYWYDNNWHYLRQWHHLKKMMVAAKLPAQLYDHCPDYGQIDLPQSDRIMGRTICMQIKLGWSATELQARIAKIEPRARPITKQRTGSRGPGCVCPAKGPLVVPSPIVNASLKISKALPYFKNRLSWKSGFQPEKKGDPMFRNFKTVERIVFGRGCFDQLDEILNPQRSSKRPAMAFLVDDAFAGHPLKDRLPLHDKDLLIWVNVDDEPKTKYVDQLTAQVRQKVAEAGADLPAGVIGIGGGSTMDLAKAVSLMLTNPGSAADYQGWT